MIHHVSMATRATHEAARDRGHKGATVQPLGSGKERGGNPVPMATRAAHERVASTESNGNHRKAGKKGMMEVPLRISRKET